jgi:putative addiction module killer protein
MIKVLQSGTFRRWLRGLRDRNAVRRIVARLIAASEGHFGDVRAVGEGVSEMRIHSGPGYRLYFIRRSSEVVVLLCGGDKDSQERDIERAKRMAAEQNEGI